MRSLIHTLSRAGITAGTTLLASTVLAGALLAGPARADAAEPNLSFQPDVLCNSSQMVYGLDITNNGDPISIRITKLTTGSGVATDLPLANGETTTVSLDTQHYKISRLTVTVGSATVFDTGQITSRGAGSGQCNLPLPAVRNDIAFDVTAECSGDVAANYTITASSAGPEAKVDITWSGKNGVPSYHTLVVNGQDSHTIVQEAGAIVSVVAYDAWGRPLYSSPQLIADSEGCPRNAIHLLSPKVDVECVDGSPRLYFWVMNSGDYVENFLFEYQFGLESEELGETLQVGLEVGETYETEAAVMAGKSLLVTLSYSDNSNPFFLFELSDYETTCSTDGTDTTVDTTVDTPTDSTLPDTGNEAPAPTTTVTPRSLPITGRTSTSLVIVAAALLLSGLSIRLVGRRRA